MFLSLSLVFLSLLSFSLAFFALFLIFSPSLTKESQHLLLYNEHLALILQTKHMWTDFDAFVRTRTGENSRGEGDGGKVVYVREGRGEGM